MSSVPVLKIRKDVEDFFMSIDSDDVLYLVRNINNYNPQYQWWFQTLNDLLLAGF